MNFCLCSNMCVSSSLVGMHRDLSLACTQFQLYTALYGTGKPHKCTMRSPWGRPVGRIELSSQLRECPARARPRPYITGCPRLPDRTRRTLMFSCAVSACPIRGGGRCKREDGRGRRERSRGEGGRATHAHTSCTHVRSSSLEPQHTAWARAAW